MRHIPIILAILLLTGCNTTRKVISDSATTTATASDSTSGTTLVVDSTAWSAATGSTISTSTQYGVLTDSTGMPIFDASGRPITYVSRRDTVTKVLNVEHYTTQTIVRHDTVHVVHRDTLSVITHEKTTTKTNSNGWWGLCWRLIVLIVLVVWFMVMKKRQ